MRILGEEDLRAALPMEAAIDALERAFAGTLPEAPPREHHEVDSGVLLIMPAWSAEAVGVKLVTVSPANPERGLPLIHGSYLLFDPSTLAPIALLDAGPFTGLRTAAVSGVVTRHCARSDARTLVVFGAGTQARWHVEAMRAVRPIEEVIVISRTQGGARALADAVTGIDARVGEVADVARADIVCTCTTSTVPLFDGALLPAGCHVNSVGAFRPDARELDTRAIAGARLVVETRAAALAEAGDILIPLREGAIGEDAIAADIAELVRGAAVRRTPEDITIYKSVGAAFEDLIVALAATTSGT